MSRSGEQTADVVTMLTTSGLPTGPDSGADVQFRAGATLGRFLSIEAVGRGGMGVVLRAYDPKLQREVALKVVRTGSLTGDAQARLVREARAMAKLSHPNVVAVYDVELDASEGVVLVMEYVRGTTLRRWLDERTRDWREILAAFREAGRGLAAAHREGLLHRDFKPDNVLVGADDPGLRAFGRVRVTDFGLARAHLVDGPSEEQSTSGSGIAAWRRVEGIDEDVTRSGIVLGTLPFMAPEQHADGELGPATDQYAFCVALWWALTGVRPFRGHGKKLVLAKRAGPPAWPAKTSVPRHVVLAIERGLSPDPGARWPDMHALIDALSDDSGRRQRRIVVLGGLATSSVLAIGSWTWMSTRDDACPSARAQLDGVWDDDRRSEVESAVLGTKAPYAVSMWQRIAPSLDAYADGWVDMHHDACEATAVRGEQSAAVLDLRMTCLERARVDLDATVELFTTVDAAAVAKAHALVDALPSLDACADVERLQAGVAPPSAEQLGEVEGIRARVAEAAAQRRAGRVAAASTIMRDVELALETSSYPPLRTEVYLELGRTQLDAGDYDRAQTSLEAALREGLRHGQWEEAAWSAVDLVLLCGDNQQRHAEALAYAQTADGLIARLGSNPRLEATLFDYVGLVRRAQGRFADSEREHLAALAIRRDAFGDDDPDVAVSHRNLGDAYEALGRYNDADREYRRALEIAKKLYGPDHPDLATALSRIATVALRQGRYDESERGYRRALAIWERALGDAHPVVGAAHGNLGVLHIEQGRYRHAENELTRAISLLEGSLGPDHPEVGGSRASLGGAYFMQSKLDDAERELQAALAIRTRALGPDHPDVANSLNNLAMLHDSQGRLVDARDELARALVIRETAFGPDHPAVATTLNNLADMHVQSGDPARAEAMLRRALAIWMNAYGPDHPDVSHAHNNLGAYLFDRGREEEGEDHVRRAFAIRQAAYGDRHPFVVLSRIKVAELASRRGRTMDALLEAERALAWTGAVEVTATTRARARLVVAQSLWDAHGDRGRALALARQAEQLASTDPGDFASAKTIAKARTWLATHAIHRGWGAPTPRPR